MEAKYGLRLNPLKEEVTLFWEAVLGEIGKDGNETMEKFVDKFPTFFMK